MDARRRLERGVDRRLELRRLAAPPAAVGGDDDLRLGVVDPAGERLRGEAAEDDRVRRADPGAGEHRDRQLGDHRHVDRDAVAGRDPELEQGVGGLLDLAMEVRVGDRPGVAGLADPVVGDLAAEPVLDVPVDAVVRDVELAADEPAGERQLPLERRVEVLGPADALAGELRPERLEVGLGLEVQVRGGVRLGGERRVGRECPGLSQPVLDLRLRGREGLFDGHVSLPVGWVADATSPSRSGSVRSMGRGAARSGGGPGRPRSRCRCRRPRPRSSRAVIRGCTGRRRRP